MKFELKKVRFKILVRSKQQTLRVPEDSCPARSCEGISGIGKSCQAVHGGMFRDRRRRYGEDTAPTRVRKTPAARTCLERDVHAERPNAKWLTDLYAEFHIPAGKVYFSTIIDCYDGSGGEVDHRDQPGTRPGKQHARPGYGNPHAGERPIGHSDRGALPLGPGWLPRKEEGKPFAINVEKGCTKGHNAASKGSSGQAQNRVVSKQEVVRVQHCRVYGLSERYLPWYNEQRIKMSLGAMSHWSIEKLNLAA